MINTALQFTKEMLDQFLRNRYNLDESKVLLNCLIESNGQVPQINQNKVVISLINLEKETLKPFYVRNQKMSNGNYAEVSPSERYNLMVLISANFDDYSETLKFLDAVILFFQMNPSLDVHSSANIPAGLNKLEYEIEKITYHQMQGLWTAMGAKYQPSVIYKTRLVTVHGGETDGFTPGIVSTETVAMT